MFFRVASLYGEFSDWNECACWLVDAAALFDRDRVGQL